MSREQRIRILKLKIEYKEYDSNDLNKHCDSNDLNK